MSGVTHRVCSGLGGRGLEEVVVAETWTRTFIEASG